MQKLHTISEYPLVERQVTRIIDGTPVRDILISIPDLTLSISVHYPQGMSFAELFRKVQSAKAKLLNKGIKKLYEIHSLGKHHPNPSHIRSSISETLEKDLTPSQLAKAKGVSKMTVTRHCKNGIIDAIQTKGGHWRISVSEAQKYLEEMP